MSEPTCGGCGATLEPRRLMLEGERGAVRSLLEEAPTRACPAGHDGPQTDPSLADHVVGDVREGLLVARRSRLPWRPQRCGACGEPLTMPGRRTTRSVTVTSAPGPPFTATLDVPMLRCTECVAENLPREVWPDVEAAIRGALQAPLGG